MNVKCDFSCALVYRKLFYSGEGEFDRKISIKPGNFEENEVEKEERKTRK